MPLLELYHKALTLNISQMNAYCLIIPSTLYFVLNPFCSERTKLKFCKLKHVYLDWGPGRGSGDHGCDPVQEREMNGAAGGLIDQSVKRDPGTHKWIPTQTKLFNVQILNTPNF